MASWLGYVVDVCGPRYFLPWDNFDKFFIFEFQFLCYVVYIILKIELNDIMNMKDIIN